MQSLKVKRQDLIAKVRANRDSRTKDYDQVLAMLEMSVDETILLDSCDIEAYVLGQMGTSYKPGREDHLKLYTYFQDRADMIKEAMFKTLTWSIGFAAALLGFSFAKLTDFDPKKANISLSLLLVLIAFAGLFICLYSWLMLHESGKHIRKNWENADKFLIQIPDLAEIVKGEFVDKEFRLVELRPGTLEPVKEKKWLQKIWAWLGGVMPIWRQLMIVVVLFMIAFGILLAYGILAIQNTR